jgi:hydroxymethylglutaryl-CoA synthase
MNLEEEIGQRRKLTWSEYEELHENKLTPEQSKVHTKKEFVLVDVKTDVESRGERRYIFTS